MWKGKYSSLKKWKIISLETFAVILLFYSMYLDVKFYAVVKTYKGILFV